MAPVDINDLRKDESGQDSASISAIEVINHSDMSVRPSNARVRVVLRSASSKTSVLRVYSN